MPIRFSAKKAAALVLRKLRRYVRGAKLARYRFYRTYRVEYGPHRINVVVESPWEFARASGGFESYGLDEFVEAGLRPDQDVYYEIGANSGIASLLMSLHLRRDGVSVVAFEPEANNVLALDKNLTLNGVTNVLVIPIALSEKDGIGQLRFDSVKRRPGHGGHSLSLDFGRGEANVPMMSLDSAVRVFGLPEPTLVSVDVEGHETETLRGMTGILTRSDRPIRRLVVEIDAKRDPLESPVDKLMRSFGYRLLRSKPSPPGVRRHCLASYAPVDTP